MSGCGLWCRRRLGRSRSRTALFGLVPVLISLSLACGSNGEPTAIPPPPPAPAALSEAAPVTQQTPPASTVLSPPASLASLLSLPDVVEKVTPAVASITVEAVSRGLFFDFTDEGAGSGMVVRSDGYLVTNYHVVQNASQIKVNLPSGETYDATVVGRDLITDLAVIKIDAEELPMATFNSSDDLRVGDWVVAMGNALALKGGPTVTIGIVSGKGRTIDGERGPLYDMIQTDAAINNGNSGGPLINLAGEVVGLNTAILRQAKGIGFAVSSKVALPIIDSLIEHGRVVRPLIGLSGVDVTPARANQLNLDVGEGIIVTRMSRNGPAFKAGIRVGDIITNVDDIPTPDMARFLTLLWTYQVGEVVQVEYVTDNRISQVMIELTERPPD